MEFIGKLIERVITSIVLSLLIFVVSFSYLTGRFPPRKSDFVRTFTLLRQLVTEQQSFNQQAQNYQELGSNLNLEQVAEFQRLALRRTEIGLELLGIFERIKLGGVDPVMAQKLHAISNNLSAAEKEMGEITAHLEKVNDRDLDN